MNKKGIEMSWKIIISIIILLALLIWFIGFGTSLRDTMLEAAKKVLGFT